MARKIVTNQSARETIARLRAQQEVLERITDMIAEAETRISCMEDNIAKDLEKPEEDRNQWDMEYWTRDLETNKAKLDVISDIIEFICK